MTTINKKRVCVLCVVMSIAVLLFWQVPAIFTPASMNLFAVFSLVFIALAFSFFALFFEAKEDVALRSEIEHMKSEFAELRAEVKRSQSAPSLARHENVSEICSTT